MADSVSERNLRRYKTGYFLSEKTSPFCLLQVSAYESDDPKTNEKVVMLLENTERRRSRTSVERACNLGGCTLRIIEDAKQGRTVSGKCKAASYCLKTAFEAVGEAPTREEAGALYSEIINNLERHADSQNAGNFCPRLDCGLSAGVSIDGAAGTAGQCVVEATQAQGQIEFTSR